MAVFLVTFRIHSDTSYQSRYESFQKALIEGAGGNYWREPTSFVTVKNNETIDAFCSRIYINSTFDASKDMYLVLDAEVKTGRARGHITDQDLFKLLPFVKKL